MVWQELRSFTLDISVDPKYHPKIIGRSGAVIKKLRTDHQDVNIQMPNRDAEFPDKITISGYEASANAAKDAILKIVSDLVSWVWMLPLTRCSTWVLGREVLVLVY